MNERDEHLTFEYYLNNYGECVDEEGRIFYTPSSWDDYLDYIWGCFAPGSDY